MNSAGKYFELKYLFLIWGANRGSGGCDTLSFSEISLKVSAKTFMGPRKSVQKSVWDEIIIGFSSQI